jgi:hypothetical protein
MPVVKQEVRGFAPSGMMEYWNIGKMDLGYCTFGSMTQFGLAIKLIMNHIFLKTHYSIIPLFHYSI